jgi:putative transposase
MRELWLLRVSRRLGIEPYFAMSHGMKRIDNRRIVSEITIARRDGLLRRDAPRDFGSPKTISNQFVRSNRLGVFNAF